MTTTHYQPSGRVPVTLLPVALLGLFAVVVLAWAYAGLSAIAPFILRIFIAIAYAFCLGMVNLLVALGAKVRNPDWMSRTGVVLALAAWYCQWTFWIAAMLADGEGAGPGSPGFAQVLAVAADPMAMLRFAFSFADSGILQLAQWRLPAFIVALIWLGELAIHFMAAPLMGRMRAEQPFCEVSGRWAERVVAPRRFALVGEEDAQALAAEPSRLFELLVPLARADAPDYARLELYRCRASDSFLSILNVRTHPGDGGRAEQKMSPVLDYLRLPGVDPDALLARWSQPIAGTTGDAEWPTPPELAPAVALLQAEAYAEAIAAASKHTQALQPAVRTDALRICGIAGSRLARWDDASGYWRALFDQETSAHNALQVATSSVMAGAPATGIEWAEKAMALNAKSAELPGLQIWTNLVTALGRAGQAQAAMPYLEKIRQVYADLGITDPTFLHLRRVPFFSAFLENSGPLVHAALDKERGRQWYACLLPSLDTNGREELSAWLESEFAEDACPDGAIEAAAKSARPKQATAG